MNPQFTVLRRAAWRDSGCIVLSIVHNEMEFLPAFLRHYRHLDVAGFLFLDDHSTDGTTDFFVRAGRLCRDPRLDAVWG